jgi:hypothetical protein
LFASILKACSPEGASFRRGPEWGSKLQERTRMGEQAFKIEANKYKK